LSACFVTDTFVNCGDVFSYYKESIQTCIIKVKSNRCFF